MASSEAETGDSNGGGGSSSSSSARAKRSPPSTSSRSSGSSAGRTGRNKNKRSLGDVVDPVDDEEDQQRQQPQQGEEEEDDIDQKSPRGVADHGNLPADGDEEEGKDDKNGSGEESDHEKEESNEPEGKVSEAEEEAEEDDDEEEEDDAEAEDPAVQHDPVIRRAVNPEGRPPEAGVIDEVYVENFMCHTKLRVPLCRNVNFIHGQNGSGKSAILAAIQICLGANARRTHRARNIREMIKKDADRAKVRVTLLNGGDDAYRADVYGKKITVERCITVGSGYNGYKLLNENGVEKSRSKKDLDEMLDRL